MPHHHQRMGRVLNCVHPGIEATAECVLPQRATAGRTPVFAFPRFSFSNLVGGTFMYVCDLKRNFAVTANYSNDRRGSSWKPETAPLAKRPAPERKRTRHAAGVRCCFRR